MAVNAPILAFNRGIISPLALARIDLKRAAFSAEVQTNWMPRLLGSMMLRPGWEYIETTKNNSVMRPIPFVFAFDDQAIVEATDSVVRILIDDVLVSRETVATAVTNGTFDSDIASWTDDDEAGATSVWATGGYMSLVGTGFNFAARSQQVTVAGGDQGTKHALRIVVERGPVNFRVGSTSGGDEYINETSLDTGTHSLAFTPTGDFYIKVLGSRKAASLIDSITVEAAGTLELPTPWTASDLANMRWTQSGDIIFVACKDIQPHSIERRGAESWSVVVYETDDGPFGVENIGPVRLTPSAISGDITLSASQSFFRAGDVDELFRLESTGQTVEVDVSAEDQFSDPIRVVATGSGRAFNVVRAGTWVATVTLQRSIGEPGAWVDVTTYTTNGTTSYNDGLDNQEIYYRIGVKAGDFTSGTAELSLVYASGSITGICRITGFTDSTTVDAAVLRDFGGLDSTDIWWESPWSSYRGWPTSVALYEGRLWWSGLDRLIGSISDSFYSFDDEFEGDAAPISRSIGEGPVEDINWMLPLTRLMLGTDGAEKTVRSTALDEPLTFNNFSIKDISTQGSSSVAAVKFDTQGLFIEKSGTRLYNMVPDQIYGDYSSEDLSQFAPEVLSSGATKIAIQRRPDLRIHCVTADGDVGVLVFNRVENVLAWIVVETDGVVEDLVIMPGTTEDQVYYVVNRTIDGGTVRYLEKWAMESECVGGTLNKQADSFITFTNGPASATVTGLDHLEGESVIVWADGKCLDDAAGEIATFTVTGGEITLTDGGVAYLATTGIVGLPYQASFKSFKLAFDAVQGSTSLGQRQRVSSLAIIGANMHHKGVKYGKDFDSLQSLPQVIDGKPVATDTIFSSYDFPAISFAGDSAVDSRVCLRSFAPRPATILAAVVGLDTDDAAP